MWVTKDLSESLTGGKKSQLPPKVNIPEDPAD